jgi:NADH dehydrogenase
MNSPTTKRTRRPWSDRRRLTVFLLIAFVVSWAAWPLVLLNPDSVPFLPYGPSIAALVVAALAGVRGEVRDLLRRLFRWRVHPVWYAVALLAPVALFGGPVLLALALGAEADVGGPFPWSTLPTIFAVRTILGGPLGEELGWRGFMLPMLRRRHGVLVASLLVGAVWGPWHLPVLLSGPSTDQRPVVQFLVWVLAASVLHTWLYERTGGSVLLVTLFHGALNTASSLLLPLFTGRDYTVVWWLATGTMVAAAGAVLWRGGGRTAAREAAPATVVVVGSGFGGFHAARQLERTIPADAAEIVLVSPTDHLTYGPLLPNVAAGVTEPRHVTVSLHGELRRTRHVTGELADLDPGARTATVRGSDGTERTLRWDRMILAPGAVPRLPAVPGLAEHAFSLKTLPDAVTLRDHVLEQLDLADATDDPAERRARTTFVVVGAGYTGTEAAGQLRLFSRRALARYPRLRAGGVRWILVDHAGQVLPELGTRLSRRALRILRRRGVEVRLRTTVEEVRPGAVRLSGGEPVATHTLVWAAGVTADPVVHRLGLPLRDGRLRTDALLRVPGVDGLYAIGDAAAVADLTRPGEFTAPTAQHAERQGRRAARNLAASLGYGTQRPYRHRDLGLVVDLGPWNAVARPLGVPLWGPPAALVTRGYHLLALPSRAGRLRVALDWLLDLVVAPQLTRLGRHRVAVRSAA